MDMLSFFNWLYKAFKLDSANANMHLALHCIKHYDGLVDSYGSATARLKRPQAELNRCQADRKASSLKLSRAILDRVERSRTKPA